MTEKVILAGLSCRMTFNSPQFSLLPLILWGRKRPGCQQAIFMEYYLMKGGMMPWSHPFLATMAALPAFPSCPSFLSYPERFEMQNGFPASKERGYWSLQEIMMS